MNRQGLLIGAALALLAVGSLGFLTREYWLPLLPLPRPDAAARDSKHDDHEHDQEPHVVLSDQARANLQLVVAPVKPTTWWRTITVPATVVERPGESDRTVSAPTAGVLTHVHALPGPNDLEDFRKQSDDPKIRDNALPLDYHNFGYTLGGPLRRNRAFFFWSQEWRDISRPSDASALVPDPAWLTDPANAVRRVYLVTVRGRVTDEEAAALEHGLYDSGEARQRGEALRAQSVAIRKASNRETHLVMTLMEGKNREVRRLLSAVGHEVTRLRRVQIGGLEIGELKPGKWRYLTAEELSRAFPGRPVRLTRPT